MVHSRSEQRAIHWDGLRALIDAATLPGKKSLASWMTARRRQLLTGGPYPTAAAFLQDVHLATLDHLIDEFGMAWTAERYRQLERFVRSEYTGVAQQVASIGLDICASHARLTTRLAALTTEKAAGTVADITQSLNELVFDGCLTHAGTVRIGDIEQFVAGMHVRLYRLAGHLDRHLAQMDRLNEIDSLVSSASRLLSTQEVDTLIWDWLHIRHQVFTGQPAGLREFTARVLSIPGVRSTHLS